MFFLLAHFLLLLLILFAIIIIIIIKILNWVELCKLNLQIYFKHKYHNIKYDNIYLFVTISAVFGSIIKL